MIRFNASMFPLKQFLCCAALLHAALLAGCGSKTEEEPAAAAEAEAPAAETTAETAPAAPAAAPAASPGNEVLPGASSVRNAVAQKDYDNAVGALLALRGAAVTPAQTEEYMTLYNEVKFALMDASTTDAKAARALMMMRVSSAGR